MTERTLVAGIDSSTQSCKLEVRDAESGELVRSGHRPHPPTSPPRSEQDPHAWWDAMSSSSWIKNRSSQAIWFWM